MRASTEFREARALAGAQSSLAAERLTPRTAVPRAPRFTSATPETHPAVWLPGGHPATMPDPIVQGARSAYFRPQGSRLGERRVRRDPHEAGHGGRVRGAGHSNEGRESRVVRPRASSMSMLDGVVVLGREAPRTAPITSSHQDDLITSSSVQSRRPNRTPSRAKPTCDKHRLSERWREQSDSRRGPMPTSAVRRQKGSASTARAECEAPAPRVPLHGTVEVGVRPSSVSRETSRALQVKQRLLALPLYRAWMSGQVFASELEHHHSVKAGINRQAEFVQHGFRPRTTFRRLADDETPRRPQE